MGIFDFMKKKEQQPMKSDVMDDFKIVSTCKPNTCPMPRASGPAVSETDLAAAVARETERDLAVRRPGQGPQPEQEPNVERQYIANMFERDLPSLRAGQRELGKARHQQKLANRRADQQAFTELGRSAEVTYEQTDPKGV